MTEGIFIFLLQRGHAWWKVLCSEHVPSGTLCCNGQRGRCQLPTQWVEVVREVDVSGPCNFNFFSFFISFFVYSAVRHGVRGCCGTCEAGCGKCCYSFQNVGKHVNAGVRSFFFFVLFFMFPRAVCFQLASYMLSPGPIVRA